MTPKIVLVTGGAGFVGSAVARALRREDRRVIAFDNLRRRGSELNIPALLQDGVEFIHGDVRISADLSACGPFDLLVDCSAEPSVLSGQGEGSRYAIDTNLGGTVNCMEQTRECEAAVIFLSTSRVYPYDILASLPYDVTDSRLVPSEDAMKHPGLSAEGISEGFPMAGVRSIYGASKLASELFVAEYGAGFGIPYVVNRCGVIAGPGQYGKVDQGFVTLWVARHEFGKSLAYLGYGGSGKQVRDVLHIQDLVDLVLLQTGMLESLRGQTFNIGGGIGNAVSLLELTSRCRKMADKAPPIETVPEPRPADIPWYVTDNGKIREATGWSPSRGVSEVLEDTFAWIRKERSSLETILG